MKHGKRLLFKCLDGTLIPLRLRFKKTIFCVAVAVCLCVSAPASLRSEDIGLDSRDKTLAVRVVQAAMQKKWSYAASQAARATDPLVPKIYYWLYYTTDKGPFTFNRIAAFVRQVPDWPQQGTLRLAAEKSITDDTPSDEIVRWFEQYPALTADGMDRYMKALAAENQTQEMSDAINAWWGDADLSVDQQDRFLRGYGRMIGKEAHKRRLNVTLYRGQVSSARAIARVLGHGYPELAEARISLAAGESGVDRLIDRVPSNLRNDPDLQLARLRWRRIKNMDFEAMEILHDAPSTNLMADPDAWWQERAIITRRLMERKQFKSAYLLVTGHGLKQGKSFAEAEFLSGWLALRFMKDPWDGFVHFNNLYHHTVMPISRARAAYWAGVASLDLKHPEVAKPWFEAGAKYPTTFYGQMCLAKLGRQEEIVAADPALPVGVRIGFEQSRRIQAAHILFRAGDQDDASAFLRSYVSTATTQAQFYLAAELANSWNHPQDSVVIAKKALLKGIVMAEYAFPTILTYMKPLKADWSLIHGIIRQESAFDPKAVSPSGALGMMQLMPSTAKGVARKAGLGYSADWLTDRPDYNIRLGTAYLETLLDRFNDCYPLAIASYNAGPARVAQWVAQNGNPCAGETDMLDWLELIPVPETRNYVQRVLEGVYIYRQKFRKLQHATQPIHIAYAKPLAKLK